VGSDCLTIDGGLGSNQTRHRGEPRHGTTAATYDASGEVIMTVLCPKEDNGDGIGIIFESLAVAA